nr:hypothetical protein StreXyl84_00230 [Streptomyces sp. Xyl84]
MTAPDRVRLHALAEDDLAAASTPRSTAAPPPPLGDKLRVARPLGISRTTIYRKITAYRIRLAPGHDDSV